jgi:uncharacterized protein (DUF433 family)
MDMAFSYDCVSMSKQIISASPDILGGTPVFAGTRVPVQTFIEYIKAGESIDSFLEGFPSVQKEQVLSLLDEAQEKILATVH